MRPRFRSKYGRSAGCALTFIIALFGCSENLTDPESPQFARPAALDVVKVNLTEPDSAVQDTTLFVDVLGDGFDDGSTVDFMKDGVVNEKLRPKKVHYVNKKKLTVELEIAPDADLLNYDVQVTTARGPKGIGTELFRVVEQDDPKPTEEVVVLDFTVEQINLDTPTDRCPRTDTPCNRLELTYFGVIDSLTFFAGHDAEGTYFDETLVSNYRSVAWFRARSTDVFTPDLGHAVAYWQGQWRLFDRVTMDFSENIEYAPDLGVVGEDDHFVFTLSYWGKSVDSPNLVMESSHRLHDFPHYAVYRGPVAPVSVFLQNSAPWLEITPGAKKKDPVTHTIRFESGLLAPSGDTLLTAKQEALLINPDGSREMLSRPSLLDHRSTFETPVLVATGCYTFRVVSAEVPYRIDGIEQAAWDPTVDKAGAAPVSVYYDGSGLSGGCGSS